MFSFINIDLSASQSCRTFLEKRELILTLEFGGKEPFVKIARVKQQFVVVVVFCFFLPSWQKASSWFMISYSSSVAGSKLASLVTFPIFSCILYPGL